MAEFDYEVREDGRRTGVVEKFWVDDGSGTVEVTNDISWEYDDLNRKCPVKPVLARGVDFRAW